MTVADIALASPDLKPGPGSAPELPAVYTCDGKNGWPELRWSGVPSGTAELALIALNLLPVEEEFFFDWAVAGLDPSLEGIEAGKLPAGAMVGRNSFGRNGYSICPKGVGETYVFNLYVLPERLSLRRGFDPAVLREKALKLAGKAGVLVVEYNR